MKILFDLNGDGEMNGASRIRHYKQGVFRYPQDMWKLTLAPIPPEKNLLEAINEVGQRACNVDLAFSLREYKIKAPNSWKNCAGTILCAGSLFTPNNGEASYPKSSRLVPELDFHDDWRGPIAVEQMIFDAEEKAEDPVFLLCFRKRTVIPIKAKARKKKAKNKKPKTTA